ncbi:hypothetical protein Cni_G03468 [Canna indica]|uniref:Uncharacterized protein n=1 Tax=Canna indica TaxID=4628 RepID=A0AAQ3Q1S9_9LILI|nr:hypothetical protein Cni_G03468 [Canna indica]
MSCFSFIFRRKSNQHHEDIPGIENVRIYTYKELRNATEIMLRLLMIQTWALYERGELVQIIDTYLMDDLNEEEACKFLKIGLLCTQDELKLRPSMSTVVRMLTGERDVNTEKITKPGLIGDFMDLKVRSQKRVDHVSVPLQISSGHDSSPSSSENTTHASLTFTTELSGVKGVIIQHIINFCLLHGAISLSLSVHSSSTTTPLPPAMVANKGAPPNEPTVMVLAATVESCWSHGDPASIAPPPTRTPSRCSTAGRAPRPPTTRRTAIERHTPGSTLSPRCRGELPPPPPVLTVLNHSNGSYFESLDTLEESLPINLSDVTNMIANDLKKQENPFNKRRRILIPSKARRTSYNSLMSISLPPLSPGHISEEEDEEEEEDQKEKETGKNHGELTSLPHFGTSGKKMNTSFRSNRSFSIELLDKCGVSKPHLSAAATNTTPRQWVRWVVLLCPRPWQVGVASSPSLGGERERDRGRQVERQCHEASRSWEEEEEEEGRSWEEEERWQEEGRKKRRKRKM